MKSALIFVLIGFLFGCGGRSNPVTPSPVLLVAAAAPLPPPPNVPKVTGVVRDAGSMHPLAGVHIEWVGLGEKWGERGSGVFTAANGEYRVEIVTLGGPSVPTDTIVVRATKTGYVPQLVDVSIAQDATINFDLAPFLDLQQ